MKYSETSNTKKHKINNLNQVIMLNIPVIKAAWNDLISMLDENTEDIDNFTIAGMPFETARTVISNLIEDIENSSIDIKNTVSK